MSLDFFIKYGPVILFYTLLFLLIYKNRKKIEIQAKIFFLYKTKIGIKLMKKFATPLSPKWDKRGGKLFTISATVLSISGILLFISRIYNYFNLFSNGILIAQIILLSFVISFLTFLISLVFFKQVKKAGYYGVFVGFLGMIGITIMIIKGFIELFINPNAPPVITPIIPGVQIPGSQIAFPFIYTIIALFIAVVIHEFSHGVVCKAHNIRVKSSGIGLLAILPLAFVEPDIKKLNKKNFKIKNSMFAAGPFSNILTGILTTIIIFTILLPLTTTQTEEITGGIMLFSVEGTPAREAGLGGEGKYLIPLDVLTKIPVAMKESSLSSVTNSGALISSINGVEIDTVNELMTELNKTKLGEEVIFSSSNKNYKIMPVLKNEKNYFGVQIADSQIKESSNTVVFKSYLILLELFAWIFVLNIGLGLGNLLPIGPVDGGQMIHTVFEKLFNKKRAEKIWTRLTLIAIIIVLILLFVPILRAIF